MKIDKSIIKELSDYLEEFNLTEIEITEKDTKIKVSKNNVSISNQPAATSANINARMKMFLKKLILNQVPKLLHQLLEQLTMRQNLEQRNLLR
jgi:acetyl-CoA carboxylase biotin carboxyl carrier protein